MDFAHPNLAAAALALDAEASARAERQSSLTESATGVVGGGDSRISEGDVRIMMQSSSTVKPPSTLRLLSRSVDVWWGGEYP